AAPRPQPDEIDAVQGQRIHAQCRLALQRMALAGLGEEEGAEGARDQGQAEEKRRFVDEAGHSPAERGGRSAAGGDTVAVAWRRSHRDVAGVEVAATGAGVAPTAGAGRDGPTVEAAGVDVGRPPGRGAAAGAEPTAAA